MSATPTPTPEFTDEERALAQRYVNEQIAIMERYGAAPKLTPERYGRLVRDVMKAFRDIREGHARLDGAEREGQGV